MRHARVQEYDDTRGISPTSRSCAHILPIHLPLAKIRDSTHSLSEIF